MVCCGVLYHFHSPVYLLEQIVNNFTPKYILIESTFGDELYLNDNNFFLNWGDEIDNEPGNRITKKRSAKISIGLNSRILIKVMNNLGYKMIEFADTSVKNQLSKNSVRLIIFEDILK